MQLGFFLVVYFDVEDADTRFDCCCCCSTAVAEEEGNRLDLLEKAAAAEAETTVEVEQTQARLAEVGRIALGNHVNRDRIMYNNDFKYQVGDMLGY